MHQLNVIIGSDNGLLVIQGHVISSTNAGILSIGPLGTNQSWMIFYQWIAFENIVCNIVL